jgi:hypothetical protein
VTEVTAVAAALTDPAFDDRTAEGIATATLLDQARVEAIIQALLKADGRPYQAGTANWQQNGRELYTLKSRMPNAVTQMFASAKVPFFEPTVG